MKNNVSDILKVLPHKYPFLMVDKVISKTDTNINSAAFGIAKYIGAYGVEPTWFFRDAFKMHYKRINKDIIAAYAKDVVKFMKITLKDNIK